MIKRFLSRLRRRLLSKPFVPPEDWSEATRQTWKSIREQGLTYLSEKRLASLVTLCRAIEADGVPGGILEAGCARGGSAILLCSVKRPERKLFVYDVFDMIPPPGEGDDADAHERYQVISSGQSEGIEGKKYYGYETDLKEQVRASFSAHNFAAEENSVSLVEGLVQDTLVVDEPIALAHIDVDWYEPVMVCLQRMMPKLSAGGSIVIDDYRDWGGCRKAVDEYFGEHGKSGLRFSEDPGHLVITRTGSA